MEKKKLTQEMLETGKSLSDLGFEPHTLTYVESEQMAEELAERTTITDPDGIVYKSYRYDLILRFLTLKYFWNADVEDLDNEAGWMCVYDYIQKLGYSEFSNIARNNGQDEVDDIYYFMFDAIRLKHQRVSSLSYKIGKTFESILGNEDIIKSIAESREVNETMVDMMEVFRNAKENEKPKTSVPLTMFAKK